MILAWKYRITYNANRLLSMGGSRVKPLILNKNITMHRLKMLVEVGRVKSFSVAARNLSLAQPSVSIQIQQLENAIGLKLVEKINKSVRLTDAGRMVKDAGIDILSRLDQLRDEIDQLTDDVSGGLDVAVVTSAKSFLPHYLGAFVRKYPKVEPRLRVTNRESILDAMHNSQHDIYIMGQLPDGMNVVARPFLDNILDVMASSDHPLHSENNIPLKRLMNERFLVRERGSGTRIAVDKLFAKKKLSITPFMELGSADAIMHAVIAGLGIAVLSRHSLRLALDAGSIAPLDVQGFPMRRSWYAVYQRKTPLSRASATFFDFLLAEKDSVF